MPNFIVREKNSNKIIDFIFAPSASEAIEDIEACFPPETFEHGLIAEVEGYDSYCNHRDSRVCQALGHGSEE